MGDPFNTQIMPDLSCPGTKFGGKRRHTHKKKHSRKYKTRRHIQKYKKRTHKR
jgi:hypothetical protein